MPEEISQKFTRFDVKLTVDDMLINIEMQVHNYGDFRDRALYYWSQRFGSQLMKGDAYSDIDATISINILNFSLFEHDDYHSVYRMADIEHKQVLTDKCAIHFFELTKLNKTDDESKSKKWMQLIKADSEEELDMLNTNTSTPFKECIMVLKSYSADERMKEMARRREETVRNEISAFKYATRQGMKQGMEKGMEKGAENERSKIIKMMKQSGMTDAQIENVLSQKVE